MQEVRVDESRPESIDVKRQFAKRVGQILRLLLVEGSRSIAKASVHLWKVCTWIWSSVIRLRPSVAATTQRPVFPALNDPLRVPAGYVLLVLGSWLCFAFLGRGHHDKSNPADSFVEQVARKEADDIPGLAAANDNGPDAPIPDFPGDPPIQEPQIKVDPPKDADLKVQPDFDSLRFPTDPKAARFVELMLDRDNKVRFKTILAAGDFVKGGDEVLPWLNLISVDPTQGSAEQLNARLAIEKLNGRRAIRNVPKADHAKADAATLDRVHSLMNELTDANPNVRQSAAVSIGKIGPMAFEAVDLLIETLDDKNRGVQGAAVSALGAIGSKAKTAIPKLVELVAKRVESKRVEDAIISINEGGPLLQLLSDPDAKEKGFVIIVLRKLATLPPAAESLPILLKALGDKNVVVWQDAPKMIGRYGAEAKSAIPALIDRLTANKGDSSVILALGQIGPDAKPAIPLMLRGITEPNSKSRKAALVAFDLIGPDAAEAVPSIIEVLGKGTAFEGSDIKQDRIDAINALASIGKASAPALPRLVEILRHPAICLGRIENTYEATANAFVGIGADSIPYLVDALGDADPKVRLLAGRILGIRFREGALQQVADAISKKKLTQLDGAAQFCLCVSWYRPKSVQAHLQTIQAFAASPDYQTRRNAMLTFYHLGPLAKDARATIEKAQHDQESKDVRDAALLALRRL